VQRILVVDDDAVLRGVLAEALQDEGYEVVTAADGEEAWAILEREDEPFDLVLSDLEMPNRGGAFASRAGAEREGCS
jgi:two-component system cell cycle sensor histidine kinase/response regulator CckA